MVLLVCDDTHCPNEPGPPISGLDGSRSKPKDKQPSAMESLQTYRHSATVGLAHGFLSLVYSKCQQTARVSTQFFIVTVLGPIRNVVVDKVVKVVGHSPRNIPLSQSKY